MPSISPMVRSSSVRAAGAPFSTQVIVLPAAPLSAPPRPRPDADGPPDGPFDRAVWAVKNDRLELLPACLPRVSQHQRLEVLGYALHSRADATPVLDLLQPLSLGKLGAQLVATAVGGAQPLPVIERLLDAQPRPELRESCAAGHLLHRYPAAQQAALLALLMPFGVDLNLPGLRGEQPLHTTVFVDPASTEEGARCVAAIRNLTAHGADVNAALPLVGTRRPLHLAVKRAAPWGMEMARALLEAGAEVDAAVGAEPADGRCSALGTPPRVSGETPLMLACKSGCAATVGLLLEHGADPALGDSGGNTALDYAAGCNNPEVARTLLSYHTYRAAEYRRAARRAWSAGHYKTCWAVL